MLRVPAAGGPAGRASSGPAGGPGPVHVPDPGGLRQEQGAPDQPHLPARPLPQGPRWRGGAKAKASDLEAFTRAEELQAALHRAQRQLAEERRRKDDLAAAVYRAAKDAALGQSRADRIPTPHKGKPGDHWALLHLTDWQLGKRTVDYGREVCERRVRQAVETALRLVELQRHAYRVTSCAVLLGGDMLEGVSIFPGQAWEVDGALYEQLFACAALIEQAVASRRWRGRWRRGCHACQPGARASTGRSGAA